MMDSAGEMAACIREQLKRHGNVEQAKGAQAYMKSAMPYRGVDARGQREIYRNCWKNHPLSDVEEVRTAVLDLWDGARYREERYAAQETLKKYQKHLDMQDVDLLHHMVVSGAWWDHVDFLAKWIAGSLLERHPREMGGVLRSWIRGDNLWLRRTAILSQLGFKDKTDTELLFSFCELCIEESSFWIRKAIGWALREFSKTDPDSVRSFVAKHRGRMSGLTFREASKYL